MATTTSEAFKAGKFATLFFLRERMIALLKDHMGYRYPTAAEALAKAVSSGKAPHEYADEVKKFVQAEAEKDALERAVSVVDGETYAFERDFDPWLTNKAPEWIREVINPKKTAV